MSSKPKKSSNKSKPSSKKKDSTKKKEKKLSTKGKEKIAKHRASKQSKLKEIEPITTDDELDTTTQSEEKYETDTTISSPPPAETVATSFAGRAGQMSAMIRAQEEKKANEKLAKMEAKKATQQEVVINEPVKVIADGLEAGLLGREALQIYLEDINTQRTFASTDIRILNASLDACFTTRPSPLNFRVEMLWRFTVTIADCFYGDRSKNLKMAIYGYNLLLELCNPQTHPFHYAAIHNSLQQAEHDLDRLECDANCMIANPDLIIHEDSTQNESDNIWWNKLANKIGTGDDVKIDIPTSPTSDGTITETDISSSDDSDDDDAAGLTMDDEKSKKKKKKDKKSKKKEKKDKKGSKKDKEKKKKRK